MAGPGIHAVNTRGGEHVFYLQPRVLLALLAQAVRGCDDKRSWRKGKRLNDFKRFPFCCSAAIVFPYKNRRKKKTPKTAGATPSLSTSTWTASSQARETCAGKGGTELMIFLSTPSRP